MRYMPFCIFGEVLLERTVDGRERVGGAPLRVAWHLSAFGETPHLRSAVGEDAAGQQVRDAMAGWGMDLSGVQTDPEHPTGEVRLPADGRAVSEPPPECAFDHIRRVRGALRCDFLYHGALAVRAPASAAALAALKDGGAVQVFVDLNLYRPWLYRPWRSREEVLALLAGARWVRLTRAEFALLAEASDSLSEAALAARAEAFRAAHGLSGLILTLGGGALALSAGTAAVWTRSAASGGASEAPGGAEALAAVVLLGLRHAWPLPLTMARAQAFADRVVACAGAEPPMDPGLYEPFIDQWELLREPSLGAAAVPFSRGPASTPTFAATPAPRRRGRPRKNPPADPAA